MGRRPSVFVRPVTVDEGRKLQRISRTAKDPVKLRKGRAWGPVRCPRRLRATYNRYGGVMHMLAALDLATGKPWGTPRPLSTTIIEQGFVITGQEFHSSTPAVISSSTARCSAGVHAAHSPPNSFS
ncbi:hypothetical protein [Streptomyces sp. SID486]|uniref:hypothetical protein n=1 Tax=Streptomyces sp. SID486 TaxID=2690264 RepID=UPI0019276634|nr:hypothetical protein [Streptomyces sp. SID486]